MPPPTWASGTIVANNSNDASTTTDAQVTNTLWQDTNPKGANYLARRHALVGQNCMVNSLISTVSVAGGTAGFGNIVDKDLTNAATFVDGVKVNAVLGPSITIKDASRTYASGTTAGFVVSVDASSLLSLKAIELPMRIYFYKDGNEVGYKDCKEASGSALKLTLANISKNNRIEFTAQSDWDFDEIGLCSTGALTADVIGAMKIYYAFVGKNGKYYLDTEEKVGIDAYKQATGFNGDITLSTWPTNANVLTDNNPDNWQLQNTIIQLGNEVDVCAYSKDGLPFKKGMEAGVEYGSGGVSILGGTSVKLYKAQPSSDKVLHPSGYEWKEVNTESNYSGSLIDVNLGGGKTTKSVIAEDDFNGIGLKAGVGVNLGAGVVYRMFVLLPVDMDSDDKLEVSADRSLCDEHQSMTLHSDEDVTWTCTSQPKGSSVTIGTCSTKDNKTWDCEVSGFKYAGTYTFKATAKDGSNRTAVTNVTYGISPVIDTAIRPWVNNFTEKGVSYNTDGKAYMDKYKIVSFSLIPEITTDKDNLVTPSLDDYASAGGISLANNKMLCGVFRSVPYSYTGANNEKVTVGFVTRTKWSALNLSLLNGLNVKVYNFGSEVKTISSNNTHFKVLSADLIGGDKYVTTEYSVEVDQGTPFDAITLWATGLLSAQLSDFNIYYAFVEPSANVNSYNNSVASSWQTISRSQTGATLDASLMGSNIGVAKVATETGGLSNIIDDDLTTGASIKGLANVGNSNTIAVKLGKVYDGGHQVQILTSDQNWLKVNVAQFVTLKAYLKGNPVSQKTNWNVLDVNVIGGMNKESEILWTPVDENNKPVDFDEISITFTGVAEVANLTTLYGIRITNDADGDGIPDVNDDESCPNSAFLVDENEPSLDKAHDFTSSKMYLHRTFNSGKWSTICLPVDLTFNQFISAFGNEARLATPEDCKDETPNTIQFNIPETHGNQVLLHKNKPYIIKVINMGDAEKADALAKTIDADNGTEGKLYNEQQSNLAHYKETSNSATDGQKYIIYGVNYTTDENTKTTIPQVTCSHQSSDFWPMSTITWNGTFVCPQTITGPFYTFLLKPKDETKDADFVYYKNEEGITGFRGLRCWMTTNEKSTSGAKQLTLAIGNEEITNGTTTDINEMKNTMLGNGNIYNLTGVLVRRAATSTEGLSKGIYIWNNKKIEIK